MTSHESQLEADFIGKLVGPKYAHRADIRDRSNLEANFRQHFQTLKRVTLTTDAEFARLLDEIVIPDAYTASRTLRKANGFTCDDGTPLNFTLVNIKDWCKNTFEVVSQLRINTDYSHHPYVVILFINGIPVMQIELKRLASPPPGAGADRRLQKQPRQRLPELRRPEHRPVHRQQRRQRLRLAHPTNGEPEDGIGLSILRSL